ncbi:hypothetical protein [Modicisalibacter luteus]|uniref:Transposase n=1 Tax=Modicisalibacter luteus TaxID=453962 RepID=A0ABV7M4V6_9GAMM|nr:hypothetical protein [Halomonas lutea]GHB15762.1 hypothetical protein GCM10007159_42580 [Halomonas lutea]
MSHRKPTQMEVLLKRAQPGKNSGVRTHIRRGERVAVLVEKRFGIREPYQWRAKHLQWVLKAGVAHLSAASRYDYWRTCRVLAAALGHWPDWEPHLRGSWTRPGPPGPNPGAPGGRPVKITQSRYQYELDA